MNFKAIALSLGLGLTLAGCAADNDQQQENTASGQGSVTTQTTDQARYDRYDNRPEYGVQENPRPNRRAIDAGVPADARETFNLGRGRDINYRMPHPGSLFLYDAEAGRLVFSGHLRQGDRFSYDTRDNRAEVNDRVIFDGRNHRGRDYRVFVHFPGM